MTDATDSTPADAQLRLRYAALSDVGRVRNDNQDSGYAGRWLLVVADGVGGAARGDVASRTAVQQVRRLDQEPTEDVLGLVAGAVHRASDRIAELVEEDGSLNGTSTTLTVGLFDGTRLAVGHVGDSRAYLYRGGTLTQLTKDHTFVQSLIDEGRISEEEARSHPHRNLILKAVDGVHDAEPDLFFVDLAEGDRVLLCSDGACGVLDEDRLADILSTLTVDYATVELVRASLEAGSTDNVTCVVADVVPDDGEVDHHGPLLVGAAADLPRRSRGGVAGRFLGHRSGDTGELEPVPADAPGAIATDPLDPEVVRYAPREPRRFAWLKRLAVLVVLVGLVWVAAAAAYTWTQQQYYVDARDGHVTVFRGVDASLPGVDLSDPYEESDVALSRLSEYDAGQVRDGIEADSLEDARQTVDNLAAAQEPCPEPTGAAGATGSPTPTGATPQPTDTPAPTPAAEEC
jgi:serine/threonine protein phosphatase PrpC